jgi:thioredoxin-related protein
MTTKIISALLLFSLTSCGQQNKSDCKKTLDKTPYFVRHSVSEPSDSLQMDFDILKSCGKLDSIDSELLTGPMLGSIMIQHATNDKVITYNTILKSIGAFKKTDNYPKFRDAIIASKTLENKIVTTEEFEKDRELLVKAGLSQSELDGFKTYLQSNSSQKMTYKEAFAKYSSSKQNSQPPPPEKIEFGKLVDIENAIKTGKENGKKVLLYFSCYACVNARKVEDRILTDNQVKSLLAEKFNYFIAYTDDRSEDKATNSTVGKKFIKLQADNFKTNYQPYFCIIDSEGKVLSEIGYTNKTEEFIEFLNKGLK